MSKLSELKKKVNTEEHRQWLINCYESEMREYGEFRNIVFTEAIRKLKETTIRPTEIERWTEALMKVWSNIKTPK